MNEQQTRILVLGNGPSLKTEHFSYLDTVDTLGMNAAYRYWHRIGWYPTIYACLDDQVVLSHADEIYKLVVGKKCKYYFLHQNILDKYSSLIDQENVYFLPQFLFGTKSTLICENLGLTHTPSEYFRSQFPAKLTTGSYSVRFAAHLGYTDVGLIGIDCRYTEIIPEAQKLDGIALKISETPRKNANYFFDDYQQEGDTYNIPNPEVHKGNLHLQSFEALRSDVEVFNIPLSVRICTRESELYDQRVFDYLPLRSFLERRHLSAIFVPFVRSDVPKIFERLRVWGAADFAPYASGSDAPVVELHFAFNQGFDPKIERDIEGAFQRANLDRFFAGVFSHYSKLSGLRDLYTRKFEGPCGPEGYMAGPNNQFFDIIRKFSKGMSHIAVIEADVAPLGGGWLRAIERIVETSERFWICGSHYRGVGAVQALWHINGNAIYHVGDEEFQDFFENKFLPYFYERVKAVPSLCYDIVLYDMFRNLFSGSKDKGLQDLWTKCAHRIRFSDYIVDISHADDRQVGNLIGLETARRKFPDAVLVHGAVSAIDADVLKRIESSEGKLLNSNQAPLGHVLIIDPDALDQFGHFLAYDTRIAEAARKRGLIASVIGNKDFNVLTKPEVVTELFSIFSVHSWRVAARKTHPSKEDISSFRAELEAIIDRFSQKGRKSRLYIYMYTGSLDHAEVIEFVIADIPEITANVNLFWTFMKVETDADFIRRWRPFLERNANSNSQLALTMPTEKLSNDYEAVFGVRLPVAPHPSTTFSDEDAIALVRAPKHNLPANPTVLFPGGMRPDKGFELSVNTARKLATNPSLTCRLRTLKTPTTPEEMEELLDLLKGTNVETESAILSDDDFRAFLKSGDVIVIPYMQTAFSRRTSGLVIDAMLLGRPVVALKDTWLGDFVTEMGFGIAADDNENSVIQAIEEILSNFDRFSSNAVLAKQSYLRKHSWDRLVETVVGDVEPADNAAEETGEKRSVLSVGERAELEKEYQEVVATLPTRSPIFLPTEKIELTERLSGVKVVRDIYNKRLDAVYRPRLRALREKYKGRERCFIIGNGPSLNQIDLSVLKDEVTFAVNGFFLKAKDLDWLPTFYVVEDHLVAEDRRKWINEFEGPTKLFPAYLAYCLDEADNTIFFNHRPRKSYPHGFDFSTDAAEITYAGCTVTFTCMQLAFYLGFKEIYLIGVDASYELPKDVEQGDTYGVGVLDMKSDDPNHFHPDYFGKGFRWHDPQVDKMIEAYQEARKVAARTSQRIYNATIGGKLEVFDRKSYNSIFPHARKPEQVEFDNQKKSRGGNLFPRVLVFDLTAKGDGTATGEIKANVFANWPAQSYLQVFSKGQNALGLDRLEDRRRTFKPTSGYDDLRKAIADFDPELILYRPVPDAPALHEFAMATIQGRLDTPLVTWIMDDWPARLQTDDPKHFETLDADWRWLLERSALRLSICDAMSAAFKKRYGFVFEPFANGVDRAAWPAPRERRDGRFVVRYAGALADNMTARSVLRVAEAIEELAKSGRAVRLEIQTKPLWKEAQAARFGHLKHTRFSTKELSSKKYRDWLASADAVVIGYNFDPESLRYIGLSMANKLPECLASGAPLIAHGPAEAATIAYLKKQDCALIIDSPDKEVLVRELERLLDDPDLYARLAAKGQEVAFSRHDIYSIRERFKTTLSNVVVAQREMAISSVNYTRDQKVKVDETEVVAHMFRGKTGRSRIMLDVGAHFGTSASYFDALGWTIHCFEPDSRNREKLEKRFGKKDNLTIDTRAVSDRPAKEISFFRSDESTGISGLHAFRETHREAGKVDVTTVAEVVNDRALDHVDFLKIDVEGFDFSVLKGVPWDRLKPDVIECEFEDKKTVPLGHTYREVAQFLVDKGYAVYLSQWHPIIRYGIPHDWYRLVKFPSVELAPDAWGNIVAFKVDPELDALSAAFEDVIARKNPRLAKARPAMVASHGDGNALAQPAPRGGHASAQGKPTAPMPNSQRFSHLPEPRRPSMLISVNG